VAYLTQHHVATHPGNKGFDYPRQRTFGVAAIDILPVLAAEALYAIEQGDFEKAYETFDTASYAHILGEFLPYYAFTAIKTGKTERINRYLSEYFNNQTGKPVVKDQQIGIYKDASFNARLAQAVIDAGSGDHAAAMILLKSVNAAVEHTEERLVFTRYQIIETARLLYVHSGVEQYKQFALDLARRNRVIEPIQTYSASFVAMLSDDKSERVQALALLLSLDPGSRSVINADPEELREARNLPMTPVISDSSGDDLGI
jgi:hypothetical protein